MIDVGQITTHVQNDRPDESKSVVVYYGTNLLLTHIL
jgi:hypothetical protein